MKYILLIFALITNTTFGQSTNTIFIGQPYTLEVELPNEKSRVDIYLYEIVSQTELKLIKTNTFKRLDTQLRLKTSFLNEGDFVYLIRIQNGNEITEQKYNVKVIQR